MKSLIALVCGVLVLSSCSTKPAPVVAVNPVQNMERAPSQESVGQWLKEYWLDISGQQYVKDMKDAKSQCINVYNGIKQGIADAAGKPNEEVLLARLKIKDGIAGFNCDYAIINKFGQIGRLKKKLSYPWKLKSSDYNEACVISYKQIGQDLQTPAGPDLKIKTEIENSCSLLVGYQKDLRIRAEIYGAFASVTKE